MKNLNQFIIERLKLNNNSKADIYNFFPKSAIELNNLVEKLLNERGPDADLNDINVSNVPDFNYSPEDKIKYDLELDFGIFSNLDPHNIKIDKWDVRHITDMSNMFFNCYNLDCNLNNWKTTNLENISYMFYECKRFDSNLSNWDVRNVLYWANAFEGCINFKGKGLNQWNPEKLKYGYHWDMFKQCKKIRKKPQWYIDKIIN